MQPFPCSATFALFADVVLPHTNIYITHCMCVPLRLIA